MARIKEMKLKPAPYGQFPAAITLPENIPIKVRISGRFIPDFTIDLREPGKGIGGILDLIQPKVTIFIGNVAYEINWKERKVKQVDPRIFEKGTLMDALQRMGGIPTLFLTCAIILGILKLLK